MTDKRVPTKEEWKAIARQYGTLSTGNWYTTRGP